MTVLLQSRAKTPICWNMLTIAPDVVGQGTWVRFVSTNYLYNGSIYDATPLDGDNFTVNFRCPAGTYTLHFNDIQGASYGIVDVDIDGVEVGSKDMYSAGSVFTNVEEITGIVLSRGDHTLKFRIDGKNGSSSNYFINLSHVSLQRTA